MDAFMRRVIPNDFNVELIAEQGWTALFAASSLAS